MNCSKGITLSLTKLNKRHGFSCKKINFVMGLLTIPRKHCCFAITQSCTSPPLKKCYSISLCTIWVMIVHSFLNNTSKLKLTSFFCFPCLLLWVAFISLKGLTFWPLHSQTAHAHCHWLSDQKASKQHFVCPSKVDYADLSAIFASSSTRHNFVCACVRQ